MCRSMLVIMLLLCMASLFAVDTFAHSGGTNAAGCHTNRKTGDYHCHTPKAPQPGRQTYCHVVNGENRCGYALSTCQDLQRQFGGNCRPD